MTAESLLGEVEEAGRSSELKPEVVEEETAGCGGGGGGGGRSWSRLLSPLLRRWEARVFLGTVPVVVAGALLELLALLAVFFLFSLFLVLWTGGIMPALMQMVMTSATDSPRSTKSNRGRR